LYVCVFTLIACAPHGVGFAEQFTLVPPFCALHVHVHGPVPDTVPAIPDVQRVVPDGAVTKFDPFALPQVPLIGHAVVVEKASVVAVVQAHVSSHALT